MVAVLAMRQDPTDLNFFICAMYDLINKKSNGWADHINMNTHWMVDNETRNLSISFTADGVIMGRYKKCFTLTAMEIIEFLETRGSLCGDRIADIVNSVLSDIMPPGYGVPKVEQKRYIGHSNTENEVVEAIEVEYHPLLISYDGD